MWVLIPRQISLFLKVWFCVEKKIREWQTKNLKIIKIVCLSNMPMFYVWLDVYIIDGWALNERDDAWAPIKLCFFFRWSKARENQSRALSWWSNVFFIHIAHVDTVIATRPMHNSVQVFNVIRKRGSDDLKFKCEKCARESENKVALPNYQSAKKRKLQQLMIHLIRRGP